ncbi:MAG: hypothetical protein Q4D97_01115 [Eubacteriales bacterium]|nr:hypothetical protein [Eubacteriales bacterium]
MLKLPAKFLTEMQELWSSHEVPGDLQDFFACFQDQPTAGLVLNRLKVQDLADLPQENWSTYLSSQTGAKSEETEHFSLTQLTPVPWAESGYFLPHKHRFSASLSYRQGLFYLQDPSAMLPADLASAQAGEWVLDLCAAPGGKAFTVIGKLGEEGLLWANEINEKRARALSRNVELAGSALCLVSCRDALGFARQFSADQGLFDLVLADVPCTGSAMFRKDPRALQSWSRYRGQAILDLQAAILDEAAANLRPGGRLVYSTCSYSWAENEGQLIHFLERHPDFSLVPVSRPGVSQALADPQGRYPTSHALRIWPHLARGEGQFAALLLKSASAEGRVVRDFSSIPSRLSKKESSYLETWEAFRRESLSGKGSLAQILASPKFCLRVQEDKVHLLPSLSPLQGQTYYLKTGLYLGQVKGEATQGDFQPSQALAQYVDLSDVTWALEVSAHPVLQAALRGETLLQDQVLTALHQGEACLYKEGKCARVEELGQIKKGAYLALTFQKRPLLWLKQQDHFFKNTYPRSWL